MWSTDIHVGKTPVTIKIEINESFIEMPERKGGFTCAVSRGSPRSLDGGNGVQGVGGHILYLSSK